MTIATLPTLEVRAGEQEITDVCPMCGQKLPKTSKANRAADASPQIEISSAGRYPSRNRHATLNQIQDVWAAVSADGATSVRRISDVTGIKRTKVASILWFLREAGYIKHMTQKTGWKVIIPLGVQFTESETK